MRVESIIPGALASTEKKKDAGPGVKKTTGFLPTIAGSEKKGEVSPSELEQAVEQLNNTMQVYHTKLRFEIHERSGEIMVKVLNSEDGSVVREIPPEKTLDMVAYFKEMLGLIIDKLI